MNEKSEVYEFPYEVHYGDNSVAFTTQLMPSNKQDEDLLGDNITPDGHYDFQKILLAGQKTLTERLVVKFSTIEGSHSKNIIFSGEHFRENTLSLLKNFMSDESLPIAHENTPSEDIKKIKCLADFLNNINYSKPEEAYKGFEAIVMPPKIRQSTTTKLKKFFGR